VKLNWIVTICCALLVVATASYAVPIDGMVLVSATSDVDFAYFLSGDTTNVVAAPSEFRSGILSRQLDRVAYTLQDAWPATVCDIWTADLDGTNAVNVTAALGGVNCKPDWSPDGTELAFQRAVPYGELPPCQVGFEIWVMDADGSNAHRVSPLGLGVNEPSWSVDGFRISCGETDGPNAHLVDKDGTDWATPPDLGGQAQWSPDGTMIASVTYDYGEVGGEPGVWRKLILTDAAGANPSTLRLQFITDAALLQYLAENGGVPTDPVDLEYALRALRMWIGPCHPQWSPHGNQILFREITVFNPYGSTYSHQSELWLYDCDATTFTQITDNDIAENEPSWGGFNTTEEQDSVSIGAVTVSFSMVLEGGVTVVLRDDDPPDVAAGLQWDGCYFEIHTTAIVTGPITVCMEYSDAAVPEGQPEDSLAITHWDGEAWVDATVFRDPENNVICAEMDSLSPIGLYGARIAMFSDVPAWGYGAQGLEPFWAYYAIQSCADGGVVAGYPDGSYQPTSQVDRAQMAVFAARALAGNDGNVPPFADTPTFPDVGEMHWALKYVEYAVTQNVVGGYPDGFYRPNEPVTRGQMAVFVARALVAPAGDGGVPAGPTEPTFPDVTSSNDWSWCYNHVEHIAGEGVAQGYTDGLYHPEYVCARDQMAVFIARAFGLSF